MERVINSYAEYQHEAGKTMKPETDMRMAVLHCTMGMVGEAGEYAELPMSELSNKKGEVGDCMWYAANLATAMGWNFEDVASSATLLNLKDVMVQEDITDGGVAAMVWACRLNDMVKKVIFYGKEIDPTEVQSHLNHYVAAAMMMSVEVQEPLLDLMDKNIKKLRARFGGGAFDAQKAIRRDYKAESEASGLEIK